jgi:hypothetical protein
MWDWGYLIIVAGLLMWAWWPIGAWHLWSFMWLTIFIVVLIFEVIGRFLSPEKKTISNMAREYRKAHPVMFWGIQALLWMGFAYALLAHLAT